jgi:hypothetical protein
MAETTEYEPVVCPMCEMAREQRQAEYDGLHKVIASLRSQLLEARAELEAEQSDVHRKIAGVNAELVRMMGLAHLRADAATAALRSLREGVEGLTRYGLDVGDGPYQESTMEQDDEGVWLSRADVLRLIPPTTESTDGG